MQRNINQELPWEERKLKAKELGMEAGEAIALRCQCVITEKAFKLATNDQNSANLAEWKRKTISFTDSILTQLSINNNPQTLEYFYDGTMEGLKGIWFGDVLELNEQRHLPGEPEFRLVPNASREDVRTGKIFIDKKNSKYWLGINNESRLLIRVAIKKFSEFRRIKFQSNT
ncbi:MAG: hypothetical protein Q7T34_00205 [Candidatus Parcubacteria bacterium]|nr:hypothetical protein [Candidatus Parcubacteria bacterium]